MDWRAAFKGAYIAAVEFGGKCPTLTIGSVRIVKVEDEKTQRERDKLVIFFKEVERGWIPCKTSAICLAAMWGNETDKWCGKRVTLHAQRVKFGRETVDGIRVKGSPDITDPITVAVKLPRRKPQDVTLTPTGATRSDSVPDSSNEEPADAAAE